VHPEVLCEYRSINVHQLKNRATERLNNEKPGKNYIHFPFNDVFDVNYFQMLTAEHLVGSGNKVRWEKKSGQKRNEPWDLLVYVLWLYDFLRPGIRQANEKEPLGLVDQAVQTTLSDESYRDDYSDLYETACYEDYA